MSKKIMHVTEALGGGVLHCVALLANLQARSGYDVMVLHSVRSDTPDKDKLDATFDGRVRRKLISMRTSIGFADIPSLIALLISFARERPDVIHLHSSKAGALGRVAAFLLGMSTRTFYSPHGFAFLKTDISGTRRNVFLLFERVLHALGSRLIGCSRSEVRYARMLLSLRRVTLVENAVDMSRWNDQSDRLAGREVIVCSAARVTYQKAPWRFSEIARSMSAQSATRFVWFGDGSEGDKRAWIDDAFVEVSGWIEPAHMHACLRQCDVFLLTSLWEGMPIALIEAQAAGLPAVATRITGNRDVILHGVTGFLADSEKELLSYTRRLVEDAELRERMGRAAKAWAFRRFEAARYLSDMNEVYGVVSNVAY